MQFFIPNSEQALLMVSAPLIGLPVFVAFRVCTASVIRYLPDKAIWTMIQAVTISVILWVCAGVPHADDRRRRRAARHTLSLLGAERRISSAAAGLLQNGFYGALYGKSCWRGNALYYGAGDAGRQLANALRVAE